MAGKGGGGEVRLKSLCSSSLGVIGDQALLSAALRPGEVEDVDEMNERCSRNLVALCHDLRVLDEESAMTVS